MSFHQTHSASPPSVKSTTIRRGRPRKNGIRNPADFERALKVLYWFEKARRGLKYEAAIAIAARKTLSSTAEIKRILAEFRSRDCELGLIVGEPRAISLEEAQLFKALELPEALWNNPNLKALPFGIGPVPRHSRINARQDMTRSCSIGSSE